MHRTLSWANRSALDRLALKATPTRASTQALHEPRCPLRHTAGSGVGTQLYWPVQANLQNTEEGQLFPSYIYVYYFALPHVTHGYAVVVDWRFWVGGLFRGAKIQISVR